MTTSFRITQKSIGTRTVHGLQANLDRLGRLQEQLSSGKQLSRPSDSPTGAVSALRFRSEIRSHEQYVRNAEDGLGWLGTIDTALTSSLGGVRRVRDLVLQGMSAGTGGSPLSRQAIAAEVEQLRETLLGVANTTYLDRPVFGGTTPGSVAYDAAGGYVGDANPVSRTVGDNSRVRVDVTGPEVFGSGPGTLFAVLSDIADHLRADPAALSADLGRLDTAMTSVQNRLSEVGARYSRVEQMRQTAGDRLLGLRNGLSDVEDIDLPKTIVDLQLQQVAYESALGATSRVVQPSLLDFLR